MPQTPASHTSPRPHGMLHPPQCAGFDCSSTHWLLHTLVPIGHTHRPPEQVWSGRHALPHPPQLNSSLVVSTQALLQLMRTVGTVSHIILHAEFEHTGLGPVHTLPHAPQLFGSLVVSPHVGLSAQQRKPRFGAA